MIVKSFRPPAGQYLTIMEGLPPARSRAVHVISRRGSQLAWSGPWDLPCNPVSMRDPA
jgi:hypothetical protein